MPDHSSEALLAKPGVILIQDVDLIQNTNAWRTLHAFAALLGGVTNLAASILAFRRNSYSDNMWVGMLFLTGSVGFFVACSMEFLVPTEDVVKRFIVSLSMAGYALYIAGSVGMFPDFSEDDDMGYYSGSSGIMIWGYLFGSALVGVVEVVDLFKLSRTPQGFFGNAANANLFGLKAAGAGGALGYLVGTSILGAGDNFDVAVAFWVAGASSFVAAAGFLFYRHFALNLA
jgi:hypothetical protein